MRTDVLRFVLLSLAGLPLGAADLNLIKNPGFEDAPTAANLPGGVGGSRLAAASRR